MDEINFNSLLNATFGKGTLHIKHLEIILKCLINKLNLQHVNVDIEGEQLLKIDPVVELLPSIGALQKDLCTQNEDNPITNMIHLLNITKRIEALEISVNKITSLMHTIIQSYRKRERAEDEGNLKVTDEKLETKEVLQDDKDNNESDTQAESIGESVESESEINAFVEEKSVREAEKSVREEERCENTCCLSEIRCLNSRKTLGSERNRHLLELPSIEASSHCPLQRFETTCKQPFHTLSSDAKYVNLCDLRQLENHLRMQSDKVNTVISGNQHFLQHQVCQCQMKIDRIHEQIEDLFFACEQNDGKINEAVASMDEFNSKIFCLKADVRELLNDAGMFREKFLQLDEKYEAMNNVKTNKSFVEAELRKNLNIAFSEMEKFVKLEEFHDKFDVVAMRMSIFDEELRKLCDESKKAFTCFKALIDEKMERSELGAFKNLISALFNDFLRDLKILLYKMSQKPIAMGAFKNLQNDLNCIACDSKVSMSVSAKSIPELNVASRRFKHGLSKVTSSKGKQLSRVGRFCVGPKLKPLKAHQAYNSFLNFPSTQQCFIVSKDNTICKADPTRCLENPKYTKF